MKFKLKLKNIPRYISFLSELRRYERMTGAEKITRRDLCLCLDDRTSTTSFDTHYFYQDIWAFREIFESGVKAHVDVGSKVDYVGFLSTITQTTFIDIRQTDLSNFESKAGSILKCPMKMDQLSPCHASLWPSISDLGDTVTH